jgi:hypothetical protein
MEFGCSVCEYISCKKENVLRHINRKKSCGPGIKEVVEIPVEIRCEFCNKNFSCSKSLNAHMKNSCKHKNDILQKQLKEANDRNKELEKLLKERPVSTTNNITNNNIIIVNNYENTSLEKLTDKTYNKLIKDSEEAYKIIPNLLKHIHFNSKIPENHNVYLSNRNKNNKHLQVFKNGHWEITDKNTEINNIIADKETNIGDWVNEKGEKYPEAAERYQEYLEQKYDEDTAKLVKEEVEFVLYNGRHLINT